MIIAASSVSTPSLSLVIGEVTFASITIIISTHKDIMQNVVAKFYANMSQFCLIQYGNVT